MTSPLRVHSRWRRAAVALGLAGCVGGATATVVSAGSNDPLAFTWSYNTGSLILAGSGSLTVSGFNSNSLTVGVSLTNSTVVPAGQRGDLVSFGFGIDPNATGITFQDQVSGGLINASLASIPSLSSIEVCAWGGQNCSGGGNGGIAGNGGSDMFTLLLAGTWGDSVDIAPIGFKYQTTRTSYEFTTGSSSTSSSSTGGQSSGQLPEPGSSSLALAGLAVLGAGFWLRRRRDA